MVIKTEMTVNLKKETIFGRTPQTAFIVDEVSNIIKEAIEGTIGGNAYLHSKVNQWTTSVVEQILSQLTKLGKPFKYVGTCTVRWENKTMYCIVSAFGLAI
ncbi:dynein light chain Tctex-type 1 isoform X3 [Paroedura picta]|uniref:dynein light chain Tctex-type 1 isoform X3 n=1 Tax=Paroedura picta TaxID=143630 RepID=UPI00405683D1